MRAKGHWPKVPDLIWFSLKHHWADDVCVSSHTTIKNIGHRFGLASLDQLQGVWGRWTFVSCAILHVREAEPAPTCTDLFWWLPTPVCFLDPTQSSQALLCAWQETPFHSNPLPPSPVRCQRLSIKNQKSGNLFWARDPL